LRILFDTNIILDVLLNRTAFVELSSNLVNKVEAGLIDGYLCATTVTTLDYLLSKSINRKQARIKIKSLLTLFQVAEVNHIVVERALNSAFNDFEDAVQYYSAIGCQSEGIVTRNPKDYKNTTLPIYTPNELNGIIALPHNKS